MTCKEIMPRPYREQHDEYMRNYMTTRQPRVLGKSRMVEGVRSDGNRIRLTLTLSEVVSGDETIFIAAFEQPKEISATVYADMQGRIVKVYGNMFGLLGYTSEDLMGQNVSILAVEPHASNHDQYIRHYQTSRVRRAMDRVRNLQARHKTKREPVNIAFQLTEVSEYEYRDIDTHELVTATVYCGKLTPVDDVEVIVTCDANGCILAASKDFLMLFGYEEDEIVGHNISLLAKERGDIDFSGAIRARIMRRTVYALHKDGSFFAVSMVIEAFTPSDNTLVEQNGQLYRATIQRIGKRKVTDKEGRELVNEGEYMGHYTYGKALGFGYFGQVREATHRLTQAKVAIKTLRKKQYQTARMKYPPREVEVLEALDHPHINRLYDKVVLSDRVHLILEHIEGRELCDIVEKHTIPEDTVRELWRQMLLAIEYMHGIGLVHRDLKLENMMVDVSGNLKVIDMGFGNFFKSGELLGTFCGSPDYAAPELFKGKPYSAPEVDIWSLGVVLYATLSGCLPFPDTPSLCAGRYSFTDAHSPLARDLISTILKVNPAQRPTIQQMMNHPWTVKGYDGPPVQPIPHALRINRGILKFIQEEMGLDSSAVERDVKAHVHNNLTTTYFLLLQRREREQFELALRRAELEDGGHVAHAILPSSQTTATAPAPTTPADPMAVETPQKHSMETLPSRSSGGDSPIPPLRKESVVASQLAQAGKSKSSADKARHQNSCIII